MAGPLCLEFPGALYHVMSRGNRREAVYTPNFAKPLRDGYAIDEMYFFYYGTQP